VGVESSKAVLIQLWPAQGLFSSSPLEVQVVHGDRISLHKLQ
jgi:hypothetical protein